MFLLKNFKYLLARNSLSICAIGKKTTIGSSDLSKINRGICNEMNLCLQTVIKISSMFGISLHDFVFKDLEKNCNSGNKEYGPMDRSIYLRKNTVYLSEKRKITLSSLSLKIGCSINTLNRLKRGESKESNMPIRTVAGLASYFNLTLDELVFEDLSKKDKK